MERLYDARGNRYLVVSPEEAARRGVPMPATPAAAARAPGWTRAAVDAFCRRPAQAGTMKPFICDGLLIGPFEATAPFNLLIVNTGGSLAERSGNGLTIFATALKERGLAPRGPFGLDVHYGGATPQRTDVELGDANGSEGIWLSLGEPAFGPEAVGARPEASLAMRFNTVRCSSVPALAALNGAWSISQFVRIGNPHCVTILDDPESLPSWDDLHARDLFAALKQIADPLDDRQPGGLVCPAGINLQWAAKTGPDEIAARIFERGEGPTLSSGTSAIAVAAAALRLGLAKGPRIEVVMPGGTAPVIARRDAGRLEMRLFGVAERVD